MESNRSLVGKFRRCEPWRSNPEQCFVRVTGLFHCVRNDDLLGTVTVEKGKLDVQYFIRNEGMRTVSRETLIILTKA
ncbi:hypothetical protein [Legionella maioricensis]|uniref:Uncharacterized protein n=1 Tax=Legionella maioricensis TaxID=2896528 RepID=A0A9X2CYG3_9GAMM|nr:hypothetical protein [Legionella maioricensis]MCL9683096.1 hypothetical protein [Legionella maioricensis]